MVELKVFIIVAAVTAQLATVALCEEGGPKVDLNLPSEQTVQLPVGDNVTSAADEVDTYVPSAELRKLFPFYKSGYDYDGIPVYMIEYGHWSYKLVGQRDEAFKKEFGKYFDQIIERMVRDGSKNRNQGMVLITDYADFSLGNFASSAALQLALRQFGSLTKVNDALRYGFFINTNFGAQSFINIARPFLGNILEKFEVYGADTTKWKPNLLRKIPSSQLPLYYGGDKDYKPIPWNAL